MTFPEQRMAESEALGRCNSLTMEGDFDAAYEALIAATKMAEGHDLLYFRYQFLGGGVFGSLMRFPARYIIRYLEQYSPHRHSYEGLLETQRAFMTSRDEQVILDFMAANYPPDGQADSPPEGGPTPATGQTAPDAEGADHPPHFRNYQAEALKTWVEDSGYIRRYKISDKSEMFYRLLDRIIPEEGNQPLYRAEGFKSRKEFQRRLEEVVSAGGIRAGSVALSFSENCEVPMHLALRNGSFVILYQLLRHHSARKLVLLVAQVSPDHGPEVEVAFIQGTRFGLTEEAALRSEGALTVCELKLREMKETD